MPCWVFELNVKAFIYLLLCWREYEERCHQKIHRKFYKNNIITTGEKTTTDESMITSVFLMTNGRQKERENRKDESCKKGNKNIKKENKWALPHLNIFMYWFVYKIFTDRAHFQDTHNIDTYCVGISKSVSLMMHSHPIKCNAPHSVQKR